MLIHILHAWRGAQRPLSEVPKATPRFDDSLGGLIGLCIESAIRTAVIYCVRRTQSKISKGKRCLVRSPENTGSKLPESPPRRGARDTLKSPSIELWQCVPNVADQRSWLETQFPGSLLGAVHRGTFCLAGTQIPDPQKKTNISREPRRVYKQLRHSVPVSSVNRGETLPKSRLLDASQGTALYAGLSNPTSRPALWTRFCTPPIKKWWYTNNFFWHLSSALRFSSSRGAVIVIR